MTIKLEVNNNKISNNQPLHEPSSSAKGHTWTINPTAILEFFSAIVDWLSNSKLFEGIANLFSGGPTTEDLAKKNVSAKPVNADKTNSVALNLDELEDEGILEAAQRLLDKVQNQEITQNDLGEVHVLIEELKQELESESDIKSQLLTAFKSHFEERVEELSNQIENDILDETGEVKDSVDGLQQVLTSARALNSFMKSHYDNHDLALNVDRLADGMPKKVNSDQRGDHESFVRGLNNLGSKVVQGPGIDDVQKLPKVGSLAQILPKLSEE